MTLQHECPDDAAWKQWVGRDCEEVPGESSLVTHLDQCQHCQQAVSNLFEADPFSSQSRNALKSTGLTSVDWRQADEESLDANFDGEVGSAILSIVQALLGPTEVEGSIGRLGRFEVLGIVGSGGMGIVLKARSVDMDRVVAIKIPQPQYWQSTETLLTLEREARSAAAVVHPNVIAIYHVDRYRDVPYLVMPYLPGQSLEQRIQHSGPLSIEETLRIARQVASALAAAHACGVVHRDVKPANILLGSGTERVVLSDFGLAKIQSDATCTATGTFAGTPIYLSPEQASGHGAGPSGDLYSLGTVIWTMICGEPPLVGMHTHAIVRKIAEGQMPTPIERAEETPDWMLRLIKSLHAEEPARRPSAESLVDWIEACQKHLADPVHCPLPESLRDTKPLQGRLSRNKFFLVGSLLLLVVLLVGGWQLYQAMVGSTDEARKQSGVEVDAAKPTLDDSNPDESKSSATEAEDDVTDGPESYGGAELDSTNEPQGNPPVEVQIDATDLFLDEVHAELNEIKEITEPAWETKLKAILGDES